jgi:hypothetical protein
MRVKKIFSVLGCRLQNLWRQLLRKTPEQGGSEEPHNDDGESAQLMEKMVHHEVHTQTVQQVIDKDTQTFKVEVYSEETSTDPVVTAEKDAQAKPETGNAETQSDPEKKKRSFFHKSTV